MPAIARATVDYTSPHDSKTIPERTYATGSPNVFLNEKPMVRIGDPTFCGDIALSGSGTVFANGLPVHRLGDAVESHESEPIICETGSENVSAG